MEGEMFPPCLGLLIPGDTSQLSPLQGFGSLAEPSQKKTGSQMLSSSFWKLQFPKVQQEQLFSWDVLALLVPGRT